MKKDNQPKLPQARRRTRDTGLQNLDWDQKPEPREAQFDALRLRVEGTVDWDDTLSFAAYIEGIANSGHLGAKGTPGRSYRSTFRNAGAVTGEVEIRMRSPGPADALAHGRASFEIKLNVNQTRVRALAIRRARGDFASLPPFQFFDPLPSVDEVFGPVPIPPAEIPVAGGDNILLGEAELGGTSVEARTASRDEFLQCFEAQLKALIVGTLWPHFLDRETLDEGCQARAPDKRLTVNLEWPHMTLERAEVYWERWAQQPGGVVHKLRSRGMEIARSIKVKTFYDEYAEGGMSSLVIPLNGERNFEFAVYAKSNKRIRFEIRYLRDFSKQLQGVPISFSNRLPALLRRLAENAERRLPWSQLAHMARLPQAADFSDVPVLFDHLAKATRGNPTAYSYAMRSLLYVGAVTADEEAIPGIEVAIRKLVRAGVLTGLSFQMKEKKKGRRYALTDPFQAARRKMLRGFAPEENAPPTYWDDDAEDGMGDWAFPANRHPAIFPTANSRRR